MFEPQVRNRRVFTTGKLQIGFVAIDADHESVRPDGLRNPSSDRAGSTANIQDGKAGPQ